MEKIGGYFELELPHGSCDYHQHASLFLKNGRAALRYILEKTSVKKVYLPFFSCHVLLEPIQLLDVEFEFIAINECLEFKQIPNLQREEILLYINYFGLKSSYINKLTESLKGKIIIDNTHDFFFVPSNSNESWYFNSCRKSFGVPDGAYLYAPQKYSSINLELQTNDITTIAHLWERMNGNITEGYAKFIQYEESLNSELIIGSETTTHLLSGLEFSQIQQRRKDNFAYLHSRLKSSNQLTDLCSYSSSDTPFCYPYLPETKLQQQHLWKENIFIPILWRECFQKLESDQFPTAKRLANHTLHLPIDHRYDQAQMEYIVQKIRQIEESQKKTKS